MGTTVVSVVLERFCVPNLESENKFNHLFGALHSTHEYQLFQTFGKRWLFCLLLSNVLPFDGSVFFVFFLCHQHEYAIQK